MKPSPTRIEGLDYAKPLAFLSDKPRVAWEYLLYGIVLALVVVFGVALLVHSGGCK